MVVWPGLGYAMATSSCKWRCRCEAVGDVVASFLCCSVICTFVGETPGLV